MEKNKFISFIKIIYANHGNTLLIAMLIALFLWIYTPYSHRPVELHPAAISFFMVNSWTGKVKWCKQEYNANTRKNRLHCIYE